jgi:enamine deaminase RidA (YjgF/YER057c/UK114 family)
MKDTAGRKVAGIIDGPGGFGATVAAGGGFAFFGATASDSTGKLAAEAYPPEPYAGSAAAQAQAQARVLFDILQIENYVQQKVHADPFFKVATSKQYLGAAAPVAATAQVGDYAPAGAAAAVAGIAIVPDQADGRKESPDDPAGGANRKFSEIITAGPYGFTTLFPSDRKSGLPEAARTPEWIWSGSEIGAEMKWAMEDLGRRLDIIGASFSDIVDYTVFLTDPNDLFEVDEAIRGVMGSVLPSRTVIPARGFALPRREGAFGHADGAPRMEMQLRILRPGQNVAKHVVPDSGATGFQAAAVRVENLLWLSSQVADSARRGSAAGEVDNILDKLGRACRDAGTDLSRALRLRVLVTDAGDVAAVYDGLRKAFPADPPAVNVTVVPSRFPVADARVAIDAVALVGP